MSRKKERENNDNEQIRSSSSSPSSSSRNVLEASEKTRTKEQIDVLNERKYTKISFLAIKNGIHVSNKGFERRQSDFGLEGVLSCSCWCILIIIILLIIYTETNQLPSSRKLECVKSTYVSLLLHSQLDRQHVK